MQYCLLLFWFLRMMFMLRFFASVMDCLQQHSVTFQCLDARLLPCEGMARAQEDPRFYFLQLLPSKVDSTAMWPLLLSCFLLMGTGKAWRCAQKPWRCRLMGHRGGVGSSHLFGRGKSFQLLPIVSHSKLDALHSDHLGGCQPRVDRPQLGAVF